MKIIVGLGNPGEKYKNTRHNIGFIVVDKIMQNLKTKTQNDSLKLKINKKFQAEVLQLTTNNLQLILVKPQTFVNNSGLTVAKIRQYYNINKLEGLYVIHDDLDIVLGEYKVQFGKGPRQHNGLKSIEQYLKSDKFWRIRIGIQGKNYQTIKDDKKKSIADDYVLRNFSKEEKKVIDKITGEVVLRLLST